MNENIIEKPRKKEDFTHNAAIAEDTLTEHNPQTADELLAWYRDFFYYAGHRNMGKILKGYSKERLEGEA